MITHITGIPIIYDPRALKETKERLFPYSRHRSKRIRKKLIKRLGGEFRMEPCIWQTPWAFHVHPSFKDELERQIGITP